MRDISEPYGLCSIDPITLGAAAIGAFGASMFGGNSGSSAPGSSAVAPAAPPPQTQVSPEPKAPVGTNQSQAQAGKPGSSFLGAIPTPPPSTGQKTLLGQ